MLRGRRPPKLGRMNGEARLRAIDFVTALDDACAQSRPPCPGGHVLLDSRHPVLWSANHVRVERAPAPAAAALDDAAATHLDALGFRMITVLDEAAGVALTAPLGALGYRPAHELLMILGPHPAPTERSQRIVEVGSAELAQSRIAAQVELDRDAEVGRQLASRDALIGAVVAVRRFAIRAGGQIVARCQVYGDGAVAQIENMYTTAGHRRQGLSRLLMRHAVGEALDGGAELVFLLADAADWPQAFYRRLGFDDAGLLPHFLRP